EVIVDLVAELKQLLLVAYSAVRYIDAVTVEQRRSTGLSNQKRGGSDRHSKNDASHDCLIQRNLLPSMDRRLFLGPRKTSRPLAKRLELDVSNSPCFLAARRRKPEQTHGVVFRAALQCQFANEEISVADLALFCVGVGIVRRGKHRLGRHLPEIKADDRRWPLGHVDLHRCLGKSARQIAAPLRDVAPQSRIGGFGIELDRLVEIGQSFWQRPRIKIGKSTIEILTEIFC